MDNRKQLSVESIETAINTLADATDAAKADTAFKAYLRSASRFYAYSWTNQMLIAIQRPTATYVAGFQSWKKHNRTVSKGAKGIHILAPMVINRKDKQTAEDVKALVGFRSVCVFDIADTTGDELPVMPTYRADEVAGAALIYGKLCNGANRLGFTITHEALDGPKGTAMGNTITLETSLTPTQAIGTLAHEMAHCILHFGDNRKSLTREQKELEAEATSYAVLAHFGIEQPSQFYLASWEADAAKVRASLATITKAVTAILKASDAAEQQAEAA